MRSPSPLRLILLVATLLVAGFVTAACGGGDSGEGSGDGPADLVLYSGREKELVSELVERFEQSTDLNVEVRYAESPELAATLLEEGDNSEADVFYAQDAGAIGAVDELLAPLPDEVVGNVQQRFRDDQNRWTGVTGRARVLAYNTEMVSAGQLPDSVLDLTDPAYRGKVGIAPTNASFEGFVTALRLDRGDDVAREWLEGMAANEAVVYEKNSQIAFAVADGEVPYGLINHYYVFEVLGQQEDAPIALHFFPGADPGSLINVSAVGIVASGSNAENAERFVSFLLDEGQTYFATEAEEREYPVADGFALDSPAGLEPPLPPLEQVGGPDVDLSEFGAELQTTVEMIQASGLAG